MKSGCRNSSSGVEKAAIREEITRRLSVISRQEHIHAAGKVCASLRAFTLFQEAKCIGIYSAVQWEIDVMSLVEDTCSADRTLVMPRWNAVPGGYEFAVVESLSRLGRGRFGIVEPLPEAPVVDPQRLDVVLVPGVAFSQSGARIGRGKGYYDRLLEHCDGVKMGICHDCQLVNEVPRDEWDEEMNYVVTPTRWISSVAH